MFNRKIIYSICALGSLLGGYALAAPPGLVQEVVPISGAVQRSPMMIRPPSTAESNSWVTSGAAEARSTFNQAESDNFRAGAVSAIWNPRLVR